MSLDSTSAQLPWLARQVFSTEVLFWLLFWPLVLGAVIGGLSYIRATQGVHTACVKVDRVEWKYQGGRMGGDRAFVHYRFPGQTAGIRSERSWLAGGNRGYPQRDPVTDAWLAAPCVQVWFTPGLEHRATPEQPRLPFTTPFGPGQWFLAAFVLVGLIRLAAVRQGGAP